MTRSGDRETGIAAALALHRDGRLAEAEAAYRDILAIQPDHPGLLHNLGVIAAQRGEHDAALALLDRALAARPDYPDAHVNRAGVLQALGRFEAALTAYERAVVLAPRHPAPLEGKGDVLKRLGRLDDAARCYERVLALNPHHYSAHRSLALVLNAQDRRAEAMAQFSRTLALRRQEPLDPGHISFRAICRAKIRHDIAQYRYLASAAGVERRQEFDSLARRYEGVEQEMNWPEDETAIVDLPEPFRERIGESYNRPVHLVEAPEIAGGAIDPRLDTEAITRAYLAQAPGVVHFAGLLSPEALQSLRRFLLGSTIWFDFAHIRGFLAAYLEDGMACPLLLQIAAELRHKFPAILGNHPLSQAWAFKGLDGKRGIDVHADAAAVSLNFWITPDDANLEPGRGGLIVHRTLPPVAWRLRAYDADIAPIRDFLHRHEGGKTVIPYGANRAVFFDSALFHESDAVRFRPGYENHRINITMLFGERPPTSVDSS